MDEKNKFLDAYKKKMDQQGWTGPKDTDKDEPKEKVDKKKGPEPQNTNQGKDIQNKIEPKKAEQGAMTQKGPESKQNEQGLPIQKGMASKEAKQKETSLKFEQKSGFKKPEKKPISMLHSKAGTSKTVVTIAISAVALIGLIIGLVIFFNRGAEVIDFTGWTESDAQLWAKDNGVILQVEKEYNDEVEAGKVISQSIDKGSRIKKGEFIKLMVSLGHDLTVKLPLPDLMSMTRKEVEDWAAKNFMAKVRITAEHSTEVPLGKVIRYEINDDTVVDKVSRNTPIYVIVSKGVEDEGALVVTVPNFKEMGLGESYTFANENGIVLIVEEQFDDYAPEGAIMSQSVKAEEKVAKDTEITLVISKGKRIVVPNFGGYSKEKATAVAAELGIPVTIEEKYSGAKAGAFISQSLKADTEYEKGDILELTYSLGNSIVLPSFVGQTRDAIESWAKELNEQGASISIKATSTQSNSPKGTILYQDKESSVIGTKATINITVSLGKVIYVPDFVAPSGSGYDAAITREKALEMCEESGIVLVFQEAGNSDRLPGEVWSQSIEAGKEVSEGTAITLKYAPANVNVTIPNFVGMTKDEIVSGDYNKSLDIRFEDGEFVEGSEGKVYRQSLHANTKAAAGSIITLYIGNDMPGGSPVDSDEEK